jgi:hypothetical protein
LSERKDEWKTTFRTRHGHFEYSVMPFINAPVVFQHMMNDIFQEYLDHFVVIYLDDILIHSKNEEEYEHHVQIVLEKLREQGLYAKQEKCLFHQSMVEFLDYIVSGDGISIDEKKKNKLLLIGLHPLQFGMCNDSWVLQTFIGSSSRIIPKLPLHCRVVTRTFSDGRTDGRSDDGRGGVRDLDAL